ncbi:hypothetical protein [Pseudocolwellia agarivorans]|uniref:hypothetical protein n=1 Tax=Pseudocolwellia agarivorans TaxID=1911682 RepID=UPI000984F08D|nr:hypothetical protein [Pseudocolwellia agarivorans]
MQKSDQVSLYFLDALEKIRFFVNISDRHMKEEFTKYTETDIETDETTYWDRYQYRNDLSMHFKKTFPQYQKQSHLLMLVSFFEDYLNQLCHSIHFEQDLNITVKDLSGSGIERAKNYLKKVVNIQIPTNTNCWKKIIEARDIRNIVAHNAGYLDKKSHQKHFQIVKRNSHLDSEEFARVHLNIKQEFLLEVISAMENVVNAIWKNTK